MAALCVANPDLSRKCQTEILRALASAGQRLAGEAIGKSETWVSRFASEHLKTCADLLGALNLKVVPAEMQCYEREYVDNLRYFAKLGMALHDGTQQIPTKLTFEEES